MVSSPSLKLLSAENDSVSRESSNTNITTVNIEMFNIGMRVCAGDDFGTIAYVGELQGYTGLWLGIEWDNPVRGKHNGTVNGISYFKTKYEKSGSFVRPHKINIGRTISEALQYKYGQNEDAEEERLMQERLDSISKSINAPFLELVGFDKLKEKQSDFKRLKVIGLHNTNVNSAGNLKYLSEQCPHLQELDLSKNLFTSWSTIYEICSDLKQLKRLNVSENKLMIADEIPAGILNQLKMVSCGQMNLTWHNIVDLSKAWPNIEELRAPFNNIDNLQTDLDITQVFAHLKTISLQNNPIELWSEINCLGHLDSLEKLVLTECLLQHIELPDCDSNNKTNLFNNLQFLSLTENKIDNWKSISELEKLRNLTELRITKNPLDKCESAASCFQLIVAYIGNLKNLNGRILLAEERRGAEYDYMNKYANEWYQCQQDVEKLKIFLNNHPRYPILVKKYGSPEQTSTKDCNTSLKSNLIELELINDDRRIKKLLPPAMLIDKLVTLVQRLFRLEQRPTITYISINETNPCERQFDNNLKDLNFYSLQSGDQIIVRSNSNT